MDEDRRDADRNRRGAGRRRDGSPPRGYRRDGGYELERRRYDDRRGYDRSRDRDPGWRPRERRYEEGAYERRGEQRGRNGLGRDESRGRRYDHDPSDRRRRDLAAAGRAQTPQERQQRDARTVCVTQLVKKADEEKVRAYFNQVGRVVHVSMVWDRHSGRHRGFAFVEMADQDDARKALLLDEVIPDFQKFAVRVAPAQDGRSAHESAINESARGGAPRAAGARIPAAAAVPAAPPGSFAPQRAQARPVASGAGEGRGVPALPPGREPRVREAPPGGLPGGPPPPPGAPLASPAPAAAAAAGGRVFVGNIPRAVQESDLEALFGPFGDVRGVQLGRDARGASQGYAFVTYSEEKAAREAVASLNEQDIAGQRLKLSIAHAGVGERLAAAAAAAAAISERPTSAAAGTWHLDDDDGGKGVTLDPQMRAQLMAKLGGRDGPAGAAAPPPAPARATLWLVLRNMFDPALEEQEAGESWHEDIRLDLEEECRSSFGNLVGVKVDRRDPAGVAYVAFGDAASAQRAMAKMHGRWFAKRRIEAAYVGEAEYEQA